MNTQHETTATATATATPETQNTKIILYKEEETIIKKQ